MADQWLVIIRGRQHGPLSSRQLRQLASDGRLGRIDLVSKVGTNRWTPAGRVKRLFPFSEPPAPAQLRDPPPAVATAHAVAAESVPVFVSRMPTTRGSGARKTSATAAGLAIMAACVVLVAVAAFAPAIRAAVRQPSTSAREVASREPKSLQAPAAVKETTTVETVGANAEGTEGSGEEPSGQSVTRPVRRPRTAEIALDTLLAPQQPAVESVDAPPAVAEVVAEQPEDPADPFAEPAHLQPAAPDPMADAAAGETVGDPGPASGQPKAADTADAMPAAASRPSERSGSRKPLLASSPAIRHVRDFMQRHCFECHGPDVQENEIRLDDLSADLSDPVVLATWQDALDQINKGEIPPQEQPRPDAAEIEKVAAALGGILADAYARQATSDRKAVVRRLNRSELRNTLRDLLYLDGPDLRGPAGPRLEDINGDGNLVNTSRGPVREFPNDEELHGFDMIGQQLVMSDFLMKLVLGAAEEALRMATRDGPAPSAEPRKFTGHLRRDGPGLEALARASHPDFDMILQRYREPGAAAGILGRVAPHDVGHAGVGLSARYRITLEVSAHNQKHPWGEMIKSRQDEPMKVGLHTADTRRGAYGDGNPTCRQLREWEIPADGSRQTLVHEAWFDEKWTPWIGWENASYDGDLLASRLIEKYYPDIYVPRPKDDAPEPERQAYEPTMAKKLFERGYLGPHVRVYSMTIEPLIDSWPPRSHVTLYGRSGTEPVEGLILQFARRAFREPVTVADAEPYVSLVKAGMRGGASREEALRAGYTAILASPRFLYIDAGTGGRSLAAHQLAERLSYFLWSSMPDEELSALADKGELATPQVLRQQVDRMLAHENATEFVERFVDRWLRLDKLGKMPPEMSGPFRWYWDRQMESEMRLETYSYFAELLERNGPVRDFIDSDYSFMNERIATIVYDRRDVWGNAFRKVKLTDTRRGGVITHASVLTATANGVDTSPVVRGVWVLESLLGSPPPPPPPNVQPLPPDLRGALTIRDQLVKHRADAACAACHRKIDPMGFAMESFNAVGIWRTNYPGEKNLPVDPTATMPNGLQVPDIVAFRKMLLDRETDVTRSLCEKLLIYGTGRLMEPGDRGQIDAIVSRLRKQGGGFRDLIHLVVQSDLFCGN